MFLCVRACLHLLCMFSLSLPLSLFLSLSPSRVTFLSLRKEVHKRSWGRTRKGFLPCKWVCRTFFTVHTVVILIQPREEESVLLVVQFSILREAFISGVGRKKWEMHCNKSRLSYFLLTRVFPLKCFVCKVGVKGFGFLAVCYLLWNVNAKR